MDEFIDSVFGSFVGRMQDLREAKRRAEPLFNASFPALESVPGSALDLGTLPGHSGEVPRPRPVLRLVGGRPSQSSVPLEPVTEREHRSVGGQ